MTTTPTIWKPAFVANIGAGAGNQTVPRTIGLANGNFLVVWEDTTNGTGPGIDIIGRMFTPEGIGIGTPFQLNSAVVSSDETGPKIVAMPDGGYVVAYGSYLEALGGFIGIERFDANGYSVSSKFITDPNSSLTKWEITADDAGNYTVVYEKLAPHALPYPQVGTFLSQDIFATTYNYLTNAAGPETALVAQNSGEKDDLGAIDTFASGKMITFYNEPDYDFFGNKADTVEFSIIDPVTGIRTRNPVEIDGPDWDDDCVAMDVACLAYGPFVLLYKFNDNYAFRIGASEASGSSISSRNWVDTFGGLGGARVVALDEGGFFIEWLETNAHILYGQRYAATGAKIGALMIISTNVYSIGETDMSLTSDGRILVPFRDNYGEINTVILDPRETTIYGTDNGEALTAQTTSSQIFGYGGNDSIYGHDGDDRIDGGLGLDTLYGGGGGDIFYLNDANRFTSYAFDTVVEYANGGVDWVEVMSFYREGKTSIIPSGYALPENVENGIIKGVDNFWLYGNALDNSMIGNGANNVLDGKGGADSMSGGLGNDDYYVDNAGDKVFEVVDGGFDTVFASVSYTLAAGREIEEMATNNNAGTVLINLTGNGFAQTITGNAGANVLNGMGGADTMSGLGGNDAYAVDNAADAVIEAVGGGMDRVYASVSYVLAVGQEIETLSTNNNAGLAAINLKGNGFANALIGNAGANVLNGAGGIDTMTGLGGSDAYAVDNALDSVIEAVGGGADRVYASVSYTLAVGQEIETLSTDNNAGLGAINLKGNDFNNALIGNSGANVLNGAGGVDTMTGLGGNDAYAVDSAADTVIEAVGGGVDRVYASVNYTLAAGQEIETLSTDNTAGLAAIRLTGNAFGNALIGNAGANMLLGGLGNDALTGGGGADMFVFNTALNSATNHDAITDFNVAADTIQLENAIFTALTATGTLAIDLFKDLSLAAQDANDIIVYNRATGDLFYDTNGLTAGGQTLFADVTNGTALTFADFVVV